MKTKDDVRQWLERMTAPWPSRFADAADMPAPPAPSGRLRVLDAPWRRVIVESPFAPRTPRLEVACMHGTPCRDLAYLEGMRCCSPCEERQKNERQRQRERHLNQRYLAACLRDCIARGESPYASHGLLPCDGVLPDEGPSRAVGIAAGYVWRAAASSSIFYEDLGWSPRMEEAYEHAFAVVKQHDHIVEVRRLGGEWARKQP